jgi:hypothetical protein
MTNKTVKDLFANDISRHIEEVIKVDQSDDQIVRDELSEYVVTDSIRSHFTEILDRYWETPNKPHDGVAIWVSGFFGSGKSSFAKYLGLALENRTIQGEEAGQILAQRTGDPKVQVLLKNISEQIPTDAVIFDVSTDRGIRSGNQNITEIMYRLFLQNLGYARDLDLSELEITLEEEDRLDTFKEKFQEVFNKEWDKEKGKVVIAVQQASRVMNALDPDTYPTADSWRESAMKRADISPGLLAERSMLLMERRRPSRSLVFVVDEVGQFVARDVQKMLDLQAVVQNLGRIGRGKLWLVVTSQERLTELVGGLDDKRVELARLRDRFPLQVHLEPSDISEVTSKRILSKNAEAEKTLRDLFTQHRGRLTDNTRLSADIMLPELATESFVDLYPLLPYQIDLIIQVVSGLRTQGGSSKHVGGANRTIIKLAQQLLIHPEVGLASMPLGVLARIDQIYDLVSGNIASEVRGKIDAIESEVDNPLAQPVAKAICLLQYVRSIHRTAENIAATLYPAVDADSRLPEVKTALEALLKAHQVRLGDDGYRIPSPAEDDWERQRASLSPKPGEIIRIHTETIISLWQPQPSHRLLDTKLFKAGLNFNSRTEVDGDIMIQLTLAEVGKEYEERVEEMRRASQNQTKEISWIAAIDETVDRETVELFRSREILSRKERGAQTKDETALVAEEKQRQRRHQDELRRLLRQALLSGSIFFRGNDRSPEDTASDIGKTAARVLSQALPEVFDRFSEAAAQIGKKDLDSLMITENLRGLTSIFTDLALVRDQGGQPIFNAENGPLAEMLARIENRTSYGEVANGRYLSDEFAKEPFGWDFDIVRLFVVALLRAGKIEATSKGQVIESALSLDARNTFPNNNLFRQASFRPKVGLEFIHLVEASEYYKNVFGKEVTEIEQSTIANAIRMTMQKYEEELNEVHLLLSQHTLPGAGVLRSALDQMRSIRIGSEDQAILTFNGAYNEIKEAIKRGIELAQSLSEPRLQDIARARKVLEITWPFLQGESDIETRYREYAEKLVDLVSRETFFRELPAIDEYAKSLEEEFERRHVEAAEARVDTYGEAIIQLRSTPGWDQLNEEQQELIAAPLVNRTDPEDCNHKSVDLLRSDLDACPVHLNKAIEEMMRIVDGNRVVSISISSFFIGGIETEEQLEAALEGLHEQCIELIGSGKKILVR